MFDDDDVGISSYMMASSLEYYARKLYRNSSDKFLQMVVSFAVELWLRSPYTRGSFNKMISAAIREGTKKEEQRLKHYGGNSWYRINEQHQTKWSPTKKEGSHVDGQVGDS